MAEGPDGKTIIIVKKVSGHGGHHGGAWKVAYADFVTSMMALFMVLWLVNSASVRTRERIASYFKQPGIFDTGSGTPLELGGAGVLPEPMLPPNNGNSKVQSDPRIYDIETKGGAEKDGLPRGEQELAAEQKKVEQVAEEIRQAIQGASEGANDGTGALGAVEVKVDQRGLHLDIMDTLNTSMFQRGSATITPKAQDELRAIAKSLMNLPNPIDIEGHTDAIPFKSSNGVSDNWTLSADRANAARRILQAAGVQQSQIARVVGYAAQRPKVPDDPNHFSNRRITISMRYTDEAEKAFQASGLKAQEFHPGEASSKSALPQAPEPQVPAPIFTPSLQPQALNVEVSTSQPEGSPQTTETPQDTGPTWQEKDKIFGGANPFSAP